MSRVLPSLTAVRVFEVAGRLKSFTNAAIELRVTQGAVSRQIRALEDELGVKLFIRLTRRVELTEQGRTYLADVQNALSHIEQASLRLRGTRSRNVLTISVLPSFGSFLLMPRLAGFAQAHPDIETRVISSIRPVDLHSGEADVAIRVGPLPGHRYDRSCPRVDLEMTVNWRGVSADELAPDILMPICSPRLFAKGTPAKRALQTVPLIHTASRAHAWPDWLRAHGHRIASASRKIEYGHFFMSLDAARKGLGIAIIPDILLSGPHIRGMIKPFKSEIPSAGSYYLLTLNSRADDRAILAFRRWLQDQMYAPSEKSKAAA